MSTLTPAALKTAVKAYAEASKQANPTYTPTTDEFTKLVTKIGEMKTLYLPQVDKLPELAGSNLPYGETIEEFMVNDFLPSDFDYEKISQAYDKDENPKGEADANGRVAKKNALRITFDKAVYSYPLKEQVFEQGIPQTQFQRISLGANEFASVLSSAVATMDSSTNAWNYATKRQLLGNAALKAIDAKLTATVTDPASWTATNGEDFIKQVLCDIEDASDMNSNNLAGHCAAAAPSLKLYVSKKVVPTLKVKTMAGAFHKEELAIPAEIKTVLDFGDTGTNEIVAILVDDRAIKLHDDINYTAADFDGRMGQENVWRHLKQTGYISKYGYIKVYVKSTSNS